ncbi:MAG: arginase [Lentimonas sp.]|jgi:arginase
MKRKVRIVINKSEITAGTRGASLGPEAIMTAARTAKDSFFVNYPPRFIKDQNHAIDGSYRHNHAIRIEFLEKVMDTLVDEISQVYKEGEFPLVLAGDHGSAAGTIAGIKSNYIHEKLGVVWIDAHGDLHTPYTTPTGNMHGMPLAIALADDNLDCKINDVDANSETAWQRLKDKGHAGAKMTPENLKFIGLRDTEEQEDYLIKKHNIRNVKVQELRDKTFSGLKEEFQTWIDSLDILYVSFDVDSMDPDVVSYGTGTPVKNGITPTEALEMLTFFAKQPKLVCLEIVEVNPCLDNKTNKMAQTTFEILKKTVENL